MKKQGMSVVSSTSKLIDLLFVNKELLVAMDIQDVRLLTVAASPFYSRLYTLGDLTLSSFFFDPL